MEETWHNLKIEAIYSKLNSSDKGLTSEEVGRRVEQYGQNKLPEAKTESYFVIFWRQFQSPLIYILLIASIIVLLLQEYSDAGFILFILLFNAVVGTIQEGKAQNTLLSLKKFTQTKATVLRDQKEIIIDSSELVPGDVIILKEGEKIPADARVILSSNLRLDESALTGESVPVIKTDEKIEEAPTIAEQKNMVFKGTHIVAGNGRAVVTATGIDTFIGKISKEIANIDTEIPLKKEIRNLSKAIIVVVCLSAGLLFLIGLIRGVALLEMFMTAVSITVSVIPEGLPIVITLILATGVWRMSKRFALVKKLQAVEALGQTQVIAVDKTGTLTKNEMVVQKVFVNENVFEITGEGYQPEGEIKFNGAVINPQMRPELDILGRFAAFCANANLSFDPKEKSWQVSGDPTEAAMLVMAKKMGIDHDYLEKASPKIAEIPFDYKIKLHATIQKINGQEILAVSGAPEAILERSKKIWQNGKEADLSPDGIKRLEENFHAMSRNGLRVVALAMSEKIPGNLEFEEIQTLTFLGFLGMKDALRPEVAGAIKKSLDAGIRVVMITGDHKITAQAVAYEAGIFHEGDLVLTGQDLENFSPSELAEKLPQTSVFARVTPEHKMKIVQAYRQRGEIIAMTGDGVNDAPPLVAADLGVAMGKIGTDVAKEAADIVLLDDNFGSIVSAVEEGRTIYKTIKKVLLYLFSTGAGEVLTIAGALFLSWPLPIRPAQILWLNLVTDGFLDVALAMEPKEEGLLRQKFKKTDKYLVDRLMIKRIILMAVPMMLGTLFLFEKYFSIDMTKAWTISLTTLAVFQWFNAWNCRSETKSIFQMNFFGNKFLIGATLIIISLQMLVVYNPFMQKILNTTGLEFKEWLVIIAIASSIIAVEEVRKFFHRRHLYQKLQKEKILI